MKAAELKEKELKVYRGNGNNYAAIPQIILQGRWVESLRFAIGDKVNVTCQQEKIVITKSTGGQDMAL